jgi:8-oxo-dGTP pyrophosphatase MutT (NUDIX family)
MTGAGGIAFLAPGGLALFVKRGAGGDHQGEWCFPGGGTEGDETHDAAARREALEETGHDTAGADLQEIAGTPIGEGGAGGMYRTYRFPLDAPFLPTLNDENTGHAWAKLSDPPQPLHPGTASAVEFLKALEPIAADHGLAFDRAPDGIQLDAKLAAARAGLALDYASVRTESVDGHLHVSNTHISKANICPYLGREIPNYKELGLEAEKVYKLFRDPAELAKAASTFNNKPLLSKHVPVSADDHPAELVIGSTGSTAAFNAPYLDNGLVVWRRDAIDDIESEEKKELSSAYRYRADMTPGEYEGESYDGVMRDMIGNHVALVKQGRAGSDVVVGDEQPKELDMSKKTVTTVKALLAYGALIPFLKPKMAQDAKLDTKPILASLAGVTVKNFKAQRPAIIAAVNAATKGKLAQDASIDGLAQLLDMVEAHEEDVLPENGIVEPLPVRPVDDADLPGFLKGKLSEDDYTKACDMFSKASKVGAADEDDKDDDEDDKKDEGNKGEDEDKPTVTKEAMDAAIKKATRIAQDAAIKNSRDIREAERFVAPWVGELEIACDSAEQVYRTALDGLKIDHEGIKEVPALKAILGMVPKPGERKHVPAGGRTPLGMDAAATASLNEMFPGIGKIKVLG